MKVLSLFDGISCGRLVDLGAGHEPRHVFLDELPENATGRKPKSCYVECGIFCTLGGEQ